jgi:hypothetical protein
MKRGERIPLHNHADRNSGGIVAAATVVTSVGGVVEGGGTSGGGVASELTVSDEGTPLATAASTLDFVGSGVVASGTGATKTITIASASGIAESLLDAKGDLIVASAADTAARLAVGGTNGHVLTVDNGETLGMKWAAAAGGSGATGARYPVQGKESSAGNQSSVGITLTSTPTNGNLLICTVASEGTQNVSSITQTNVTWTKVAETTASTAPHAEIWKGVVATSAGATATITWGTSYYCCAYISEWTGVTGTLDQSATRVTQSSLWVPTITPTDATALVISAGAESTYSNDFSGLASNTLLRFPTLFASAFGFPGLSSVLGVWLNTHGGTFSGVTVSLT